jgi:thiol-disulfide isomerase/thioredoxin
MKTFFQRGLLAGALLLALAATLSPLPLRTAQASPPAATATPAATLNIYFFWGDGCPHCAAAKPFLAGLAQRYPGVTVRDFEVWYATANQPILARMSARFGFEAHAVPTIFIGNRYWEGYSDAIGREIEAYVRGCLASGCVDAGTGIVAPLPVDTAPLIGPVAPLGPVAPTPIAAPVIAAESSSAAILDVPLLGTLDMANESQIVSTVLIAFVDGVNPCSIWVLSVLLALTLRTGSRKKVFLIGLVFIAVTAAIYALFITGLFTMLSVIRFVGWIQAAVALVALVFAVVNIKDYFWYREGLSFTIPDARKPGLYQRMRNVLNASQSTPGLIGATVVMAAGVSLIEFSCTAGFPVLWTNLLTAQKVTPAAFALLLGLYMLIYQIDELGLFAVAVVTLKANRIEEKHGRVLKLIGGMLMLALAIVMLINPALMNNLGSSLLIFAIALAATLAVLFVHRWLLPRLGVHFGTEPAPQPVHHGGGRHR